MTTRPNRLQRYVRAIGQSGLTIYDRIEIGHPKLWIPAQDLEALLNRSLKGFSLRGLPLRTRSQDCEKSNLRCAWVTRSQIPLRSLGRDFLGNYSTHTYRNPTTFKFGTQKCFPLGAMSLFEFPPMIPSWASKWLQETFWRASTRLAH